MALSAIVKARRFVCAACSSRARRRVGGLAKALGGRNGAVIAAKVKPDHKGRASPRSVLRQSHLSDRAAGLMLQSDEFLAHFRLRIRFN
jgi:hypothetical protein